MPICIFALGSNGSGQLGIGHFDDISSPEQCVISDLSDDDHVKQIVAGGNHTLILTENGKVFAAGNNVDGRCGLPVDRQEGGEGRDISKMSPVFSPLKFDQTAGMMEGKVTHIAATWEASFFVVDGKRVFACGTGSKGELGLGVNITSTPQMRLVLDLDQFEDSSVSIREVTASMSHVIMTTSNGHAYGWGTCRKGQLGDNLKAEKIIWQPIMLETSFGVSKAVVGRDYTLLIGQASEKRLLGDRKYFSQNLESDLINERVSYYSGWSNIYALSHGHLRSYGRNDRGQLPPLNLSLLQCVVAGSEHVLAYTVDGDVITWGWGEHGNCGTPVDERGNVAGRVNKISFDMFSSEPVAMLAAGCATSFIVLQSKT